MLATSYGSGFLEADPSAYQAASSPTGANDRGARIFNIRDFGAKGDGTTLDTRDLQAAIDACNADSGGTVVVPEGTFQIGTVEIKSNVTLMWLRPPSC
jgi:polygalacturonase